MKCKNRALTVYHPGHHKKIFLNFNVRPPQVNTFKFNFSSPKKAAFGIILVFFFFAPNLVIFNWRKTASQYWVGLCHTSTQASHRQTCAPSSLTSLRLLPLEADAEPWSEFPESHRKFPLVICFTYGHMAVFMLPCF